MLKKNVNFRFGLQENNAFETLKKTIGKSTGTCHIFTALTNRIAL